MKVITAIDEYTPAEDEVSVFLAGGITNCWDWQQAVIDELAQAGNTDKLVVYTPRRKDFPIGDPNAAQEQIEWEYKYLHLVDIFSMYFTAGESTQPICMYELGVHLTRYEFDRKPSTAVISVEDGYCRKQDVLIQTKLAVGDAVTVNEHANAKLHAQAIYEDYQFLVDWKNEQQDGWSDDSGY